MRHLLFLALLIGFALPNHTDASHLSVKHPKVKRLPDDLLGTWQFVSRAGYSVIGKLTITHDYVVFGSKLNGICSDSYQVRKLRKPKPYHHFYYYLKYNEIKKHDIYQLVFDNGSCRERSVDELLILVKRKERNNQHAKTTHISHLLEANDSRTIGSLGIGHRVIDWSQNSSEGLYHTR